MPLLDTDPVQVLFTMRPDTMPDHAAQASFPGGRMEPTDRDALHTGLRETEEELGLSTAVVDPIGRLDDYLTVTNYHVVPWVARVRADADLRPDPREVARVFAIPLPHLLDPVNHRVMRTDYRHEIHFYLWQNEVVWGATAAMLTNFLDVIRHG